MSEAFAQDRPFELPTGWRLAVKLRAGARALLDAATRRDLGLAPAEETALLTHLDAIAATVQGTGADAIDRIGAAWGLSPAEQVLVVAAGLPDLDPLAAELVRRLHPAGVPVLTLGTVAGFYPGDTGSLRLQRLLCGHPLPRSGLLRIDPDGPLGERGIRLGDGVWSGIFGEPLWPEACNPPDVTTTLAGLEEWAGHGEPAAAVAALGEGGAIAVLCLAEQRNVRLGRAAALCGFAGRRFAVLPVRAGEADRVSEFLAHALLRGCCPVLLLETDAAGADTVLAVPGPAHYPAPIVIAATPGARFTLEGRAGFVPPLHPVEADQRLPMWQALIPELDASDARRLAARFAMEPLAACELARDAQVRAAAAGRARRLADVTAAIRARGALIASSGTELRRASARWDDIALGSEALSALRNAVGRLEASAAVLPTFDETHRPGSGLKLLFSGPPGTGKTLAAEIVASEIGADLLVVETSKILSKWLGESERNLAAAFDAASESHSILFFDEADSLFARRTDANDSRDRYANMETAFLLQRLERFAGIAILATNLPRNLDEAFRRRFDAVIEFNDPGPAERQSIWRRHMPQGDVLAPDIDLDAIASWYAIPGGWIRNAAHAAAFAAVGQGMPLGQAHLLQAIAREYRKAGRAFPGMPPGPAQTQREGYDAT